MPTDPDPIGDIKLDFLPDFSSVVANGLTIIFALAALFFFIQLVVGGISWINAGGDSKALDSARTRITNAIIGLVIVVAAFGISVIITSALGLNIFTVGTIEF